MRDAKSMGLVFPFPCEDEEEGSWLLETSGAETGGGNVDMGDAAGNVDPPELDEAIDMDGTRSADDDDAGKAVVVV